MARTKTDRINLASIARRMGCSIMTVSRALRGVEGINAETRANILKLAVEMGYRPPTGTGKSAPSGNSHPRNLLVLSQRTVNLEQSQGFMAGISSAGAALNAVIMSHLVPSEHSTMVLDPLLMPASLRAEQVDGFVLLHRWPGEMARAFARKLPTVSIIHDYPDTSIDLVGVDDRRGIADLVGHLHAGGHRRIGFFGLCAEVTWSSGRCGAFVEALMRLNLDLEPENIVRIDLASALAVAEFPCSAWAGQLRARLKKRVDAWVCPSAAIGQALCRFFVNEGLRMPDQVSLASYHGATWAASGLPKITSTYVSDEDLGAAAVRRLVNYIENPRESRRSILLPSRLVPGQTTRTVVA